MLAETFGQYQCHAQAPLEWLKYADAYDFLSHRAVPRRVVVTLARELLGALAAGRPVSGAELARHAGVTRAAIWKQIETLRQRGLPVEARIGGGYHLPWPVQLLDGPAIRAHLPAAIEKRTGSIEVHWELDSTSSEIQRRLPTGMPDLSFVLAETQTAGRGRRGRSWLSPPGLNLYVSFLKRFDQGFAAMAGLSLAVGVMAMRALDDLGVQTAGLKWPNDILAGDAKLAGILVELSGEYQGPCAAVIGLGLNLRLPNAVREQASQAVTDLAALAGGEAPDRNAVAAAMLARLVEGLLDFEREGFAAFADDYARFDLLRGVPLRVVGPREEFTGIGEGVDARGALRVRTADGVIDIDSAEVSVRKTDATS
jgi:BirA family biotin operon repressor/biotin-[acetyl-CoA-carboxylase] ligase